MLFACTLSIDHGNASACRIWFSGFIRKGGGGGKEWYTPHEVGDLHELPLPKSEVMLEVPHFMYVWHILGIALQVLLLAYLHASVPSIYGIVSFPILRVLKGKGGRGIWGVVEWGL